MERLTHVRGRKILRHELLTVEYVACVVGAVDVDVGGGEGHSLAAGPEAAGSRGAGGGVEAGR